MQLVNRMGVRYALVVRPSSSTGFGVPPPYTAEGFISTFSPEQRRQVIAALAASPLFTDLDAGVSRACPTDAKVTQSLVALVRARRIALVQTNAAPARNEARTGAESAPSQARPTPPVAGTTPQPVHTVECELMSAALSCSHKGRKPNAAGLLEVVPGREDDRIKLESQLRGGCGQHPRWEVRSSDGMEVKTGAQSSFVAKMWGLKSLLIFEVLPRSYYVHTSCCTGMSKAFEVKAYPIDEWSVSIDVDFKKRPTQWEFEVEITPWEDTGAKLKSGIFEALEDKKKQLDYVLDKALKPLLGKSLDWEFFKTKLAFKGKWVEYDKDHRVFYQFESSLALDPLVKGTFTVPFGPTAAIPGWLKRWTTDLVGDFYLYLKITGEIGLSGKWAHESPDEWKRTVGGTGKVGVKVGGNLFLMKRGALNLDVNGGTNITAEVTAPVERKPAIAFDLKWGGIEVEITIEAAWGMVEYKRKWKPVEGGSFFQQPKVWHPLGEAAGH